ncbi:FHA domain-containing protein [Dolichospermum sp. FACHB-1091]|uniref:FHA domain-containing protein n=1 Tax=Dolichospermum sp. FACHB-1091 TaxID=2692798 RepID=UPI001F554F67|nr:FHA domain-containing protein [Dolichospermum sp. FACHB-1091]
MQSTITLTITTGKLSGKQYIFDSRTTCLIGRNDDCYLSIPDEFDKRVSRYHCLLDINPPEIRIRDLGSLNGTYINNTKIGGRQSHQNAEEAAKLNFPEYDLQHGDHITVGDTVLKITTEIKQAVNQPPDIKTPHFVNPEPKAKTRLFDVIQKLIKLAISGERNLKALLNYQIIKSIGKGGFGEVYLAQHSQTGKFVALKVMLPAVAGDDKCVQMFLR